MKKQKIILLALIIALFFIPCLGAQDSGGSDGITSLKGMSLNGATGLYSIPTGRIGWERTSNFGLDFGYHAIVHDRKATHIPKVAMSLFKLVELSAAFDIQPAEYRGYDNGSDFITGVKVQIPLKKVGLAVGGNFQVLNLQEDEDVSYLAGQVYGALTYAGEFFSWPAETTIVAGKTFWGRNSGSVSNNGAYYSDIDFGMGFDLVFLPKQLDGLIHWILDFSNFSYSVEAYGADSWHRGVLNTGLRFDLSRIKPLNKFKFVIDVILADAFDENRSFSTGLVFGIPIL